MPLINRLQRLAPTQRFTMPPDNTDNPTPSYGAPTTNPLAALASSQDAAGSASGYDTPILDQYRKVLANPPNPADFQPSRTRQVLAALAGMGAGSSPVGMAGGQPVGFRYDPKSALATKEAITDEPYNKAMGRYETQAGLLQKGADVEERAIGQKRGIDALQAQITKNETDAAIKQQNTDIARQKEHDIYVTKQAEMQARLDKAQQDLTEKQREFDAKQGNVEEQLKVAHERLGIQQSIAELNSKMREATLEESKRQHDALQAKWDADHKVAEERIKALEDAAKAKNQPVTTTTQTTTPPKTFLGFQIPGTGGVTKSTTQVKTSGNNAPSTVNMKGPDGKIYQVPSDKVEDAKKHGMVAQ